MTDTATQAPETTTDPSANDSPESTANRGKMPTYNLHKVTELPENAKSGRADLYFNLLTEVAKDPGEWYEVAHFSTASGATNALKAIKDKDRKVPDGDWEFETRRVPNPDDATAQKHSKLFARFMS